PTRPRPRPPTRCTKAGPTPTGGRTSTATTTTTPTRSPPTWPRPRPPLPPHPHYQHHAHLHSYGGGGVPAGRLIERSRRPDEVLRWVTQNPAKISHNHYPVALQKIGQLLQASPPPGAPDNMADFQTLCDAIVSDCAKFDNFSIVNCLYAVAALGEPSRRPLPVCQLPGRRGVALHPPPPPLHPPQRSARLHSRWNELCPLAASPLDSITPYTMALIAKYIARHRLRETRLLDTIADFLVKKAEYLDSKVIQKLVFPFSRMSYRPSSERQFFSRLEEVVELKALSSPLATVNILMSLFQLGHFPGLVLHRVFSSAFISNVTSHPYALIVRRYLSLLDAAIELEYREYSGPRLQDAHKVLITHEFCMPQSEYHSCILNII
uniref:Fas-activated serine/threonine kinase n=1 Tax=Myripristis murdjan TaxID=586833 RepID=A0A667XYW4_9TELE